MQTKQLLWATLIWGWQIDSTKHKNIKERKREKRRKKGFRSGRQKNLAPGLLYKFSI
jgi:hypothetical protein